jgi:hypothetical protein
VSFADNQSLNDISLFINMQDTSVMNPTNTSIVSIPSSLFLILSVVALVAALAVAPVVAPVLADVPAFTIPEIRRSNRVRQPGAVEKLIQSEEFSFLSYSHVVLFSRQPDPTTLKEALAGINAPH